MSPAGTCLEHLSRSRPEFLAGDQERILGDRATARLFFEVPDLRSGPCEDGGIWDLIYEHCGYFSPGSLERVFRVAGFQVESVEETFEGQFLTIHARSGGGSSGADSSGAGATRTESGPRPEGLHRDVSEFADYHRRRIEDWRTRLAGLAAAGRRIATWGAGSKGTIFLNAVDGHGGVGNGGVGNGGVGHGGVGHGGVEHVVDINPRKQGQHVAGTGQRIVSPEELAEHGADVVIVMNPVYRQEIRDTLERLGVRAELLDA